jgi:hypothetical protein
MRVGQPRSGDALWSTYVADSEQPEIVNYHYDARVVPVYGSYSSFVWKPHAEKHGMLLPQAPFGPPEKCYGHTGSSEPGAATLKRGGTVMLIPWAIGRTYYEFGTTDIRDYFLSSIEGLAKPVVTADLPEQVEMIVGKEGKGLVIHLINQTGGRRKSFGPHVPIAGGRVRVKNGGKDIQLLVSKTGAKVSSDGNDLVIDLPPLELFEVIRIPLAG